MPKLSTQTKVRIARLLSRGLIGIRRPLGLDAQAVVRRRGLRWHLDLREGIDLAIYLGSYERECFRVLPELVPSGSVIIDIGANIGALSLPFAALAGPAGRVISVEPTDFAFAKLARNLSLNETLSGVVQPVQAMLLESEDGEPVESIHASWPLHGSEDVHPLLQSVAVATGGAQRLTLDRLVADRQLERIDLIKLDVDGHEAQVLRGAGETLTRLRPPILIELAPYTFDSSEDRFQDVVAPLLERGYRFRNLHNNRMLPETAGEIENAIPFGASYNCLASIPG